MPVYTTDTNINNARAFFYSLYAGAYYDLTDANMNLGYFNQALWASNECIEYDYSLPECHWKKALLLIRLKNFSEAQNELSASVELIKIKIVEIQKNIAISQDYSMQQINMRGLVEYKKMLRDICKVQQSLLSKRD